VHRGRRLHRIVSVLFVLYLVALLRFTLIRGFLHLTTMSVSLHSIMFRIEHLANFTPLKTISRIT